MIVEGALFAAGVYLYVSGTRARNRTGQIAFWTLVAFLVAVYVANLGPPPPNTRAVGVMGLAMWLFVPWGVLIDRNRESAAVISPLENRVTHTL